MAKKNRNQDYYDMKEQEYAIAIEKYNTMPVYKRFETFLAVIIVFLQCLTAVHVMQHYHFHNLNYFLLTLVLAYIATDFFNGLVHMIMDNNTDYTSIVGPFVAAFHMHHLTLNYTEKHPLRIYFSESGHKFWLVVYLIGLSFAEFFFRIDSNLELGLVLFGILSSVAELSHYWCHKSANTNVFIRFLQKRGLLLRFQHHRLHHVQDNTNYGFLNGVSNPLLNSIARHCYQGYKTRSDQHVAAFMRKTRAGV